MTSKVKGQGHMLWMNGVLDHKSRTKSLRNTKISMKVTHPMHNKALKFQGQKVKGQGHQAY